MGRKSTQTDRRCRRYIRIEDDQKWNLIDRIMTIPRYSNSFNQVINDALDFGLPALLKSELGEVEEVRDFVESHSDRTVDANTEQYFLEVTRLLKELIGNTITIKSSTNSLFQAKELELLGEKPNAQTFKLGGYKDTPDCLKEQEARMKKRNK